MQKTWKNAEKGAGSWGDGQDRTTAVCVPRLRDRGGHEYKADLPEFIIAAAAALSYIACESSRVRGCCAHAAGLTPQHSAHCESDTLGP